ncbi:ABC-type transport auxiliary lipoprotein family protein [Agrobacterium tumefaciens]|uniref:ABC-type transport auxiliary lipoprotein family protein n=1 Tax=Agrobacterium TaxID=357 RepID=UPI0001FC59C5|nr:ABC-type transport auxiliary lipoprotein family protein [Agrobacterium tumefaciens]ADY64575.1 putative ABC transporter protein [Agrobacterium tumefaciens]NTC82283.1 ABC transporter [Agrobacterium tumefaciens]NTD11944.1 ABC transporter [Agrobacterium tumefaciens]CUW95055.1 putative ABC transporter protein [Agrobacterium fabacearum S56]
MTRLMNGHKRRALLLVPLLAVAVAGCAGTPSNDTFDLSVSSATVTQGPSLKGRQLLIADPTALKALDSENIVVRLSGSEVQYLGNSQWSDRLPRMVQSKLVQAFEDTGKLGGVGRPGQGLAIDYQVVSDIRTFEIDTAKNTADIEISVKLLNDRNGTVKAQEVFRASARVSGSGNANFVKALDQAFAAATREIVAWTLKSL